MTNIYSREIGRWKACCCFDASVCMYMYEVSPDSNQTVWIKSKWLKIEGQFFFCFLPICVADANKLFAALLPPGTSLSAMMSLLTPSQLLLRVSLLKASQLLLHFSSLKEVDRGQLWQIGGVFETLDSVEIEPILQYGGRGGGVITDNIRQSLPPIK